MYQTDDSAYERVVTANLSRVIDWVKYGDAKNAALIVFASAWLGAIANVLAGAADRHLTRAALTLFISSEFFFFLGASFSIAALLPQTRPRDFLSRISSHVGGSGAKSEEGNLLFFGDIGKLEPTSLRGAMAARYRPHGNRTFTDQFIADACSQLVINSRIAQRKFDFFNRGMLIVFFALCLALIAFCVTAFKSYG